MDETLIKRILPHSVEAEQSVIGSMIMDKDAITTATEILDSDDFLEPNALFSLSKIANANVTTDKIADSSVTTNKINNGSVTGEKIDENVKKARVFITYATGKVLKLGSALLGIEMPNKM